MTNKKQPLTRELIESKYLEALKELGEQELREGLAKIMAEYWVMGSGEQIESMDNLSSSLDDKLTFQG